MRISPATEFAIRGVSALARRFGEGPVPLDTICADRDLPKQYLTKIFASLTRAGLLTPVRGKRGGYMLSRAPREISVLEVIEAVQGPLALNFCTQDPPQCHEENCPFHDMWADLQQRVRSALSSKTFANGVAPDEIKGL